MIKLLIIVGVLAGLYSVSATINYGLERLMGLLDKDDDKNIDE